MTVAEIKAYVRSLVDDEAGGYFTDADLLRFINQSQQETQKRLVMSGNNWYTKIDTSNTTVLNQANYSLPSDFLKMQRIEVVTNPGTTENRYTLSSVTLNQKDMGYQDSDSLSYYLVKSTLYLAPPPKTAGRTLRLYYVYRIADVANDSDTPDVPVEFHEYLANLVALRCFLKDGRDASFIVRMTEMVEKQLDAEAIERTQDHASTVVIADENTQVY